MESQTVCHNAMPQDLVKLAKTHEIGISGNRARSSSSLGNARHCCTLGPWSVISVFQSGMGVAVTILFTSTRAVERVLVCEALQ